MARQILHFFLKLRCFNCGLVHADGDFSHVDPTGAQQGLDSKGNIILYTAGDLAATMSLNVDLKVFSANGYYDSVTPFHQTVLDLQNMPLGARLLYDTVNAIWYAAGDTASDFNFYTKRGLLAGVYGATVLYWLDDRSPAASDTTAFFERRLAEVMQIPKLGAKLREGVDWLPNPFRLLRVVRRH